MPQPGPSEVIASTMPGEDPAGTTFFGGLARLVPCARFTDARGSLCPISLAELPFHAVRAFAITDVPEGAVRGGHGHRTGQQWMSCLRGGVEVLMRHQGEEVGLTLRPGGFALMLGPGVWSRQAYLSADTVLLVFASEPYDPASYLEHWT